MTTGSRRQAWDDLVNQARAVHSAVAESGVTDFEVTGDLEQARLQAAVAELDRQLASHSGGRRATPPAATAAADDIESSPTGLMLRLLESEGFKNRLGGLRVLDDAHPLQSLNAVPHRLGLPPFDLCVAPDFVPVDGAHGIFVNIKGVFSASISRPYETSTWRIVRSARYDSAAELVALVHRYANKPQDRPS